MDISRIIISSIAILTIAESASADLLTFTPKIHPSEITLNCAASEPGIDVYRAPVDDQGKLISGGPRDSLLAGVQFVADQLDKLLSAGYQRRGSIQHANDIRYVEIARKVTVYSKFSMSVTLKIVADRNGAQVNITSADVKNPSLSAEPPIKNLMSINGRKRFGDALLRKSQKQLEEVRSALNIVDGYKIDYRPQEAVFDHAFSGEITRKIGVSYCGKDRFFKVLIRWDRRVNRPLGLEVKDW